MLKGLVLFATLLAIAAAALPQAYDDSNFELADMDLETKMSPDSTEEDEYISQQEAAELLNIFLAQKFLTPTGVKDIDDLYAAKVLPCNLCVKAVGFAVPKIAKYGCSFLFKATAVAACNAVGLGPQDPLSWVCSALLVGSCKVIAGQVAKKVTNPTKICQSLHSC